MSVTSIYPLLTSDILPIDFHVFLENALLDQGERWGGRQFRSLSVVFPPAAVYLDPLRTENEKHRFLDNLWTAQARFRTRSELSIVLRGEEREVENRGGYVTLARTYFNVYTRTAFLQEPKKVRALDCLLTDIHSDIAITQTKIVMHIDQEGVADAIPFGDIDGPYVIVRVQPMAGELARYSVTSSYEDEPEEDIMQTSRIPERIVQTSESHPAAHVRSVAEWEQSTSMVCSNSRRTLSLGLLHPLRRVLAPLSSASTLYPATYLEHARALAWVISLAAL